MAEKTETTESRAKKIGTGACVRRLAPFYGPYKGLFALDMACALIIAFASLAFPALVRKLLYDALENFSWRTLWAIAAAMIGVKALETVCRYFVTTVGHAMGAKIEKDIRMSLFEKYMRLPTEFFDNHKVGELMSRSTTDLFDITEFCHHGPEELFIGSVKLIGVFAYLMTISVRLTLIVFAALPVFVATAYFYNNRLNRVFGENRRKVAELNSHLQDALAGIRVVKSFAAEDLERRRFDKDNADYVAVKKRGYANMGGLISSISAFSAALYIVTAVAGAAFIQRGEIATPDLVAYLLYVSTLISTVDALVSFTEQFQQGMAGFRRYCGLMDAPEGITDAASPVDAERFEGEIAFEGVSFSYDSGGLKVLNDLTITVKKGENAAIVGPSGAGKTTMISLIPRFYDVSAGRISIDGTDVRDISLKTLRRNVGIVQQDVYLFNGSIADNISYGDPTADRDAIERAARLAGVDEFALKFPDGYDTLTGERGAKLSGGQKQRISIARVFLKDPPILILDEATSSLDNESERRVQASLDRLAEGRTTLTIAHRLTTVRNAERIIVLTENGIAEEGTHGELVAKGGIYAKLCEAYGD